MKTAEWRTQERVTNAREMLLRYLEPGSKVYVVSRGVAKSGMSRCIDLYAIAVDSGREAVVQRITGWAISVCSSLYWDEKTESARIHGAGMDMHFEAVYQLSYALFGRGDALTRETL